MHGSTHWKVTGSGVHLYGQAGGALSGLRVVAKTLVEQRLRLDILTLGRGFATVNLEFKLRGHDLVGRQSQTWVRFHGAGWKVAAAHVSTVNPAPVWCVDGVIRRRARS